MKKVEAIISPEMLDEVYLALGKSGYKGLTVTEVNGHGSQKGVMQRWDGKSFKVDLLPKLKLEIILNDDSLERVVGAITRAATTGAFGDGKIFIYEVSQAIRIRTLERGEKAIA